MNSEQFAKDLVLSEVDAYNMLKALSLLCHLSLLMNKLSAY
jgi:hypothetical protein